MNDLFKEGTLSNMVDLFREDISDDTEEDCIIEDQQDTSNDVNETEEDCIIEDQQDTSNDVNETEEDIISDDTEDDCIIEDQQDTSNDVNEISFLNETEEDQQDVLKNTNDIKLLFPEINEDGDLVCQVCGKAFKAITQSHLKSHNLTTHTYKSKFGTRLISEKHKQILIAVNTGRFKQLFKKHEDKAPEQEDISDDVLNDKMDDISFDQSFLDLGPNGKPQQDPMYAKTNLAYNIEELLNNNVAVKENYLIEESSGSGAFPGSVQLKYSFITDIAIPELKTAFFFPDTFWHNREVTSDHNKYNKLAEDNWKCIIIKGNDPNMEQISEELRRANLI